MDTEHTGPVHEIKDKKELAIHLQVPHVKPDGCTRRIVSPGAAVRSRWSLTELQREHAELHNEDHHV